jgi:hypothetical protein
MVALGLLPALSKVPTIEMLDSRPEADRFKIMNEPRVLAPFAISESVWIILDKPNADVCEVGGCTEGARRRWSGRLGCVGAGLGQTRVVCVPIGRLFDKGRLQPLGMVGGWLEPRIFVDRIALSRYHQSFGNRVDRVMLLQVGPLAHVHFDAHELRRDFDNARVGMCFGLHPPTPSAIVAAEINEDSSTLLFGPRKRLFKGVAERNQSRRRRRVRRLVSSGHARGLLVLLAGHSSDEANGPDCDASGGITDLRGHDLARWHRFRQSPGSGLPRE